MKAPLTVVGRIDKMDMRFNALDETHDLIPSNWPTLTIRVSSRDALALVAAIEDERPSMGILKITFEDAR